MTPYRPSGKSDPGALPVLLVAALGAGIAAGGVLHLVGTFIHLIVIWPAIMGGAAGAAVAALVTRRRVRAPVLAASLAALGGIAAWTADLALDYPSGLDAMRTEVQTMAGQLEAAGEPPIDPARIDPTARALLAAYGDDLDPSMAVVYATLRGEPVQLQDGTFEPLPERGTFEALLGFSKLKARAGTTISRTGSSSGTELGYGGTLGLWLFELLIAAGLAGWMGGSAAREPFCETCNAWYDGEATLVPVAPESERRAVLEALERGDASAVAALLPQEGLPDRYLMLTGRRCTECGSAPAHVKLVRVRQTKSKREHKDLKSGLVPLEVFDAIAAEVERVSAPAEPPAEGQPA